MAIPALVFVLVREDPEEEQKRERLKQDKTSAARQSSTATARLLWGKSSCSGIWEERRETMGDEVMRVRQEAMMRAESKDGRLSRSGAGATVRERQGFSWLLLYLLVS